MNLNIGQLYVKSIIRDEAWPYALFINGGPGQSCYGLETLISRHGFFSTLKANIVLYDQRGCGRSQQHQSYSHLENIADLGTVIEGVQNQVSQDIDLIIGHSYGAKILYDSLLARSSKTKAMFVATSAHLLVPRLNNFLLDMKYLQKSHPSAYEEFLTSFSLTDKKSLWEASEKLAPLFNLNPERPLYYWANSQVRALMEQVQMTSPYPVNAEVFQQVRKEIYLSDDLLTIEFQRLNGPYKWVVGFFDYIMGGNLIHQSPQNQIILDKSGHFPHLEENVRFCEVANEFLVS
jgi:proline iminopeptidase